MIALILAGALALTPKPDPVAPTRCPDTGPCVVQVTRQPGQFVLVFNGQQIKTIGDALVERPYKDVAQLLGALNAQLNTQPGPAPEAAPVKPKAKP